MTHRDEHGNVWIIEEPPGRCELCGAVKETRPYGPNGEQVCFPCGMKDEAAVERAFGALLAVLVSPVVGGDPAEEETKE